MWLGLCVKGGTGGGVQASTALMKVQMPIHCLHLTFGLCNIVCSYAIKKKDELERVAKANR